MNNDGFSQYIKMNNFMVSSPPYSHLLMNGGKLFVPSDRRAEFLIKYAHYVQTYKLYVIELKTKIFRLFLDLDFFQEIGLPQQMLIKYITTIQKALYTVLSHTHDPKESRVIVCLTKNKSVVKNNEEYVKTGVHLYWPDVHINTEYALIFRRILIDALEEQYGERGNHNSWDDVVDKTVLERNGLRMIGSRKLSNCTHCKTKKIKNSNCTICNSTGKIDECRIYEPLCILDGKGRELKNELTKLSSNIVKKIQDTSIQSDFLDIPKPFSIPEQYKTIKRPTKRSQSKQCTNIFDIECSNKECLEKNSKVYKMCVKFIQDTFPHPTKIDIIEIFKKGKEKQYYIVRTSSRFCLNINREHHSNHVYYYIDKSFAYQKCMCTCDTTVGRQYGKCMDYKSSGRRLPFELQKLLFPQESKKMAVLFDLPRYNKNDSKVNKDKYVDGLQSYVDFLQDGLFKRERTENVQIIK